MQRATRREDEFYLWSTSSSKKNKISWHIHRLRRRCVQVKNGLVRMMLKGGKNLHTNFILMNKLSSFYDIFLFIHPYNFACYQRLR